jgi:hypothetical protein
MMAFELKLYLMGTWHSRPKEKVEVIKRRRPKVDDGIRVYATPSESRRRSEHRRLRAEGRPEAEVGTIVMERRQVLVHHRLRPTELRM